MVTPFAFARCLFRLLAICQIDDESDTLIARSAEGRAADQDRDSATVFSEVLFLVGLERSTDLEILDSFVRSASPVGGGEVGPSHCAGRKIITVVADHLEKRIVGIDDLTF
jgi:hypothetical protein